MDAPVAQYWPEFAQGGKEAIPVKMLLNHQAGLAAVRDLLPPGAFFNWEGMIHALERQEPWWKPGSQHGYHAFGYTMNRMGPGIGMNPRGQSLVDALYLSLGYTSNASGVWI